MDSLERFKRRLEEEDVDTFIVAKSPNIFYLLDEFNLSGLLVFKEGKAVLVASNFYRYTVEKLSVETRIYSTKEEKEEILEEMDIEGEVLTDLTSAVEEKFEDVEAQKSEILEEMRKFKTEDEVRRIRKACEVSTDAMRELKDSISREKTEWELAAVADNVIRSSGCYNAFTTMVHSRTLEPHRVLNDDKVGGGLVMVDLGAKYKGYCSDMTRTFCLGPTEEERKLYEDVLDIYNEMLKEIKPGVKFSDISDLGEMLTREKGYSVQDNYLHRAGHSLGIEIHESPGFGPEDEEEIKPGMVFTLEPGLYVPGIGGVRIEDTLHVKESGEIEILTKFPKKLEP